MDITVLPDVVYDEPLQTNRQHMAREFASLGHRVLYVEPFRFFSRNRNSKPLEEVAENLWILRSDSPLPYRWLRARPTLTMAWLARRSRIAADTIGLRSTLLWSYTPLSAWFRYPFAALVYDVVDDYLAQANYKTARFARAHALVCQAADVVLTTTESLAERLRAVTGRPVFITGNAADVELFSTTPTARGATEVDELAEFGLFWGALRSDKIDLTFVAELAARAPFPLVFVGPTDDAVRSALEPLERVCLLPERSQPELLPLIRRATACIVPYGGSTYVRSVNPLKVYEALAAKKQVVSTDLPALRTISQYVWLRNEPAAFADALRCVSQGQTKESVDVERWSWKSKARRSIAHLPDDVVERLNATPS